MKCNIVPEPPHTTMILCSIHLVVTFPVLESLQVSVNVVTFRSRMYAIQYPRIISEKNAGLQ